MTLNEELLAIEKCDRDHLFEIASANDCEHHTFDVGGGPDEPGEPITGGDYDDECECDHCVIARTIERQSNLIAALRLAIESRYDGRTRSEVEAALLRALRGES